MSKIFTGQKIVKTIGKLGGGDNYDAQIYEEFVYCHKCKDMEDLIGMRSTAYYDPYRYKGKYVHQKCLSNKRKQEIEDDKHSQ